MKTKKTLLVLAAGMGSRYGGLKQIDGIGPNEEAIIEYSIYDAINAGFDKVVFIIRKIFADAFQEKFQNKLKDKIEIHYVYQEFDVLIGGRDLSKINREKPWGTAHAVLVAKDIINEPFAVINADDYYGPNSFKIVADFMDQKCNETTHCLIGYILKNTLSKHGQVNRGVCWLDKKGNLDTIKECLKIRREKNGKILYEDKDNFVELKEDTIVSMNFWAFHQSIFDEIEKGFLEFVEKHENNPKAEYFIPLIVDQLIKSQKAVFENITTDDQWFGVTYKDDKPNVVASFEKMIADGVYPKNLWS